MANPNEIMDGPTGTSSDGIKFDPHADGREPDIDKLFKACIKHGASDLHLKHERPPALRLRGQIQCLKLDPMTTQEIERLIYDVMSPDQKQYYIDHGACDMAYDLPGSDRFRVNVFRQRGFTSIAARRVVRTIPDFKALHLPESLSKIADVHQGLILLAGITGSGKSTTIAAMLNQINEERACHVVTIEDPIEYMYEDKKAFINQREIGIDVHDFPAALRYLMREDPDVALIGEMRDRETFEAALQAAETGHLVFGTVHASTTSQAIGRILNMFDEAERDMIRLSFGFNLVAIVAQKLLKAVDPEVGRVPTNEIMIVNPGIRKLIVEGRDEEILEVIQRSYDDGMIDFNENLLHLVDRDMVALQTAYEASPNPDELKRRIKGIR
jgi:twitching motility protein PilT